MCANSIWPRAVVPDDSGNVHINNGSFAEPGVYRHGCGADMPQSLSTKAPTANGLSVLSLPWFGLVWHVESPLL